MKKKKTIKINFKYFWGYFDPNDNLFTDLLKEDYEVIISDKPDYIFYCVFDGKKISQSENLVGIGNFIRSKFPWLYRFLKKMYYHNKATWKMPVLKGNFVKIFFTNENCRPNMGKCDWAFTYDHDKEVKNPRHLRLPCYKFDYSSLCKKFANKKVNMKKIKKEKTKFCNFIYSNHVDIRNNFFKKLNKYKKVESWGACYNNMNQRLPGLRRFPQGYKPGLKPGPNKPANFLKQFKFTIAFESCEYPGYVTDKLIESMAVNSIPIYWGNPLIHKDFNTKSFLNYYDFERDVKKKTPTIFFKIPVIRMLTKKYMQNTAFKRLIKRIIEIDNDDELYEKYLRQPWYNDNKPSKYVDDNRIRKRLRKIIESPKQI